MYDKFKYSEKKTDVGYVCLCNRISNNKLWFQANHYRFQHSKYSRKIGIFLYKKRNKCIACISPTVTEPSMSYQYTCFHMHTEEQDKSAWGGGVSFHRAV